MACTVPEMQCAPEEQQRDVVVGNGERPTAHERGVDPSEHGAENDDRHHVHAAPLAQDHDEDAEAERGQHRKRVAEQGSGAEPVPQHHSDPEERRPHRDPYPTLDGLSQHDPPEQRGEERCRAQQEHGVGHLGVSHGEDEAGVDRGDGQAPEQRPWTQLPQCRPYSPAALHDEDDAERTREEERTVEDDLPAIGRIHGPHDEPVRGIAHRARDHQEQGQSVVVGLHGSTVCGPPSDSAHRVRTRWTPPHGVRRRGKRGYSTHRPVLRPLTGPRRFGASGCRLTRFIDVSYRTGRPGATS